MTRICLSLVFFASACASMRGLHPVSAECREQVNHCLATCSSDSGKNTPQPTSVDWDSRSSCERHCSEICNK
jgi:hypothetical protein